MEEVKLTDEEKDAKIKNLECTLNNTREEIERLNRVNEALSINYEKYNDLYYEYLEYKSRSHFLMMTTVGLFMISLVLAFFMIV